MCRALFAVQYLITAARRAKLPGADALEVVPGLSLADAWTHVAERTKTSVSDLAGHVAAVSRVKVADLSAGEPKALKLLPEKLARRYGVFPLRETDRAITVATADPSDLAVEQAVSFAAGRAVTFEVAPPAAIQDMLNSSYAAPADSSGFAGLVGAHDAAELADAVRVVDQMEPEAIAEKEAEAAPVVKLANLLLRDGIVQGASDIHIEPGAKGQGVVRYRVDGVMREYMKIPMAALTRVVARIKVISKIDIADRLRPQDGRARVQVEGRTFDLRVSTVPTREAEKAVIRVLRPDTSRSLDDMGLPVRELTRIKQLLSYREGIVVVTGPTGSGKTTTLYAAIKDLATGDTNITTVEDPVEYELPGITQIQVEPKRGVTFASALRAVLRQDPDVIFVGEIRDSETAQIAVQASMTGHLVLATLHTNDAASSVTRLADLGLDRPSIAATLRGALAQRLVRRLCKDCAVPATDPLTPEEAKLAEHFGVRPVKRPVGCPKCTGSGYRGRIPVVEVLASNAQFAEEIAAGATALALQRAAVAQGMRLLRETALERVKDGATSLQEVERIIGTGSAATESPATTMGGATTGATNGMAPATQARASTGAVQPEALRVLVVDDDPVERRLARAMLEQHGLAVTEAEDGEDGKARLTSGTERYALVILDLHMPRLSGEGLLGYMQTELRRSGVKIPPVIILTGSSVNEADTEARLMEEGADDYVRKPFDPSRFGARVKAALRRAAA